MKAFKHIKKLPRKLTTAFLLIISIAIIFAGGCFARQPKSDQTVFLVHGLGRTSRSMLLMQKSLRKAGYRTVNFGYKSRKLSVEQAAAKLRTAVSNELSKTDAPTKIHFVTHSLGGILTRKMLATYHPPQIGRVVMLAPPNHGSEIPDTFGGIGVFKKALGPAGLELGTATNSTPNNLPPPHFELGIITGDRSFNPLFSHCISGKDDGKVSVQSAKLEGMRDFLVIHVSHTWIMNRKSVREQTIYFLKNGCFKHPPPPAPAPLSRNLTIDRMFASHP